MANLNPRITVEPGKMGGKPCIRGLRLTAHDVASYLASGRSEDKILRDFPYLENEDFLAAYEFFASISDSRIPVRGGMPSLAKETKKATLNSVTAGPISGTVERERSRSYDHYTE